MASYTSSQSLGTSNILRRGVHATPFVTGPRPRHCTSNLFHSRTIICSAAGDRDTSSGAISKSPGVIDVSNSSMEEVVFYEGSGSNAELALSLLLGVTLLYLPLTLASIGRRLWIKYRFTNKRLVVTTTSPVLQREIMVEYSKIREIRSAPRAFGLWGDMVVFLKDGARLELVGLENFAEIRNYIEGFITD